MCDLGQVVISCTAIVVNLIEFEPNTCSPMCTQHKTWQDVALMFKHGHNTATGNMSLNREHSVSRAFYFTIRIKRQHSKTKAIFNIKTTVTAHKIVIGKLRLLRLEDVKLSDR